VLVGLPKFHELPGPYVPMKTTRTAVNAAVAAKFSVLFASVRMARAREKELVNKAIIPNLHPIEVTK
jgi:hypothetical protein